MLNPHLHVLGLDGVYVRDAHGRLGFHELGAPDAEDVGRIALETRARVPHAGRDHRRYRPIHN